VEENQTQGQDFEALIEQHLPLVRHIMFQVSVRFPRHVDRTELARAGVLGLVQAARRYDEGKGVPFQHFAAQRIRGAILDAVRSVDWAPRSLRRSVRELEAVSGQLANDLGRSPTAAETAAALGMTTQQLSDVQDQLTRAVVLTLDMAVAETDDDEITLGDTLTDTATGASEELETREMQAYLHDAVALLPERHRIIIDGYFFGGRTSEELADELGISVSRISQLRSDAFGMMRDGITAQFAEPAAEAEVDTHHVRLVQRKSAYASAIAARSNWKARIGAPAPRAAMPMGVA
jgi:RNA polymerase sigma factor for flagellar operon FliA